MLGFTHTRMKRAGNEMLQTYMDQIDVEKFTKILHENKLLKMCFDDMNMRLEMVESSLASTNVIFLIVYRLVYSRSFLL